jgi:GalNAc-alpha-(1->4)-GalNAc-alpha-(1->3)-diNAcBac-PP-undecaprenol alpha-1,4-N-acetyl-D-galactosaminyltransferase
MVGDRLRRMAVSPQLQRGAPGVRSAAKRILVVISSLGGGGAERVVVELAEYLVASGREVTLLTLNGDDPDAYPVPAGVERDRMEIRYSPYFPGHSLVYFFIRLREMRQRIREARPDVVLAFLDQTNIRAILCTRGTGIPLVITERSNPARHPLIQPWRFARRMLYPHAEALVVQTVAAARWFAGFVPSEKIVEIPKAVRGPQFTAGDVKQDSRDDRVVLAVGRLEPVKGFDLLLEAFARSGLGEDGWRLVLVGEGSERGRLLEQSRRLGITRLDMPGYVHDVPARIARCSIFALTSRYEGFPNALLEAMQLGRACVSFDCENGPRELINDGQNGVLVGAEDVDALAAALRQLGGDEELRRRLGQAALDVHTRFAPGELYRRWSDVLDGVSGALHPAPAG